MLQSLYYSTAQYCYSRLVTRDKVGKGNKSHKEEVCSIASTHIVSTHYAQLPPLTLPPLTHCGVTSFYSSVRSLLQLPCLRVNEKK